MAKLAEAGGRVPREIRIYFEGHPQLKSGFAAFFSEIVRLARAERRAVTFIATNGSPARDHEKSRKTHPTAWNVLLRDSEGPDIPAHSDSVFWMVEMMESWFHGDKEALSRFYGEGFNIGALKVNPRVEAISKKDLVDGLSAATRQTSKGDYFRHKRAHGSALLSAIDAGKVQEAAPNCRKMFTALLAELR